MSDMQRLGFPMSPERMQRLAEIEHQLLSEEVDRGRAELIVSINRQVGKRTEPWILKRAKRKKTKS